MAGRRKAEGIALLSVYGGDDDDAASQASGDEENEVEVEESARNETGEEQTEDVGRLAPGERLQSSTSPREAVDVNPNNPASSAAVSPRRTSIPAGGLGIVDYGQDEGLALSPETEDGTISGDGTSDEDDQVQPDDGLVRSPSGTVTPKPGTVSAQPAENAFEGSIRQPSETADVEDTSGRTAEGLDAPEPVQIDILDDFLPPVSTKPCSTELQAKISKYLSLRITGKIFNEDLRKSKGYRNPDFLQSAVRHYDIDHIGSCFRKEVFDPHGYEQADYHDSIAQEIRREADRKEQERRQTQKVDFVRSSLQTAVTKPILPLAHRVVSITTNEQVIKTDGRASKKSKWDKVEVEIGRSSSQVISHAADALATINAHAALLSASANTGAGYASFAQQQRREAEKLRANENISSSADSSRGEKRRKSEN